MSYRRRRRRRPIILSIDVSSHEDTHRHQKAIHIKVPRAIAAGIGPVDLGQAVATLRAVKDSGRRERRSRRFSRPRRGKPKAVENGRRQFYGLAYRSRTGTLFPPALFSLSLPRPFYQAPNALHDAIHSLSDSTFLPFCASHTRSAPLRMLSRLDHIVKLYLYPGLVYIYRVLVSV